MAGMDTLKESGFWGLIFSGPSCLVGAENPIELLGGMDGNTFFGHGCTFLQVPKERLAGFSGLRLGLHREQQF